MRRNDRGPCRPGGPDRIPRRRQDAGATASEPDGSRASGAATGAGSRTDRASTPILSASATASTGINHAWASVAGVSAGEIQSDEQQDPTERIAHAPGRAEGDQQDHEVVLPHDRRGKDAEGECGGEDPQVAAARQRDHRGRRTGGQDDGQHGSRPEREPAARQRCHEGVRVRLERAGVGVQQPGVLRQPPEAQAGPAAQGDCDRPGGRDRGLARTPGRQEPEHQRPGQKFRGDQRADGQRTARRAALSPGDGGAEGKQPIGLSEGQAGDKGKAAHRHEHAHPVAHPDQPQRQDQAGDAEQVEHGHRGSKRQRRQKDAEQGQRRRIDEAVGVREQHRGVGQRIRRSAREHRAARAPDPATEVEPVLTAPGLQPQLGERRDQRRTDRRLPDQTRAVDLAASTHRWRELRRPEGSS